MTTVCIRQPGYLPYIGFFKKIESSDIFVYLDDAQYTIGGWDNRNKIKTSTGSIWLTVPVLHPFQMRLNQVLITNDDNWKKKHLMSIKNNYSKCKFFNKYWADLENIITKKWNKLIDLNLELIKYLNFQLGINTKTIKSSELGIIDTGSSKLLEICKKLNSDIYLSGIKGKEYLDEKIFEENGIKVIYERFEHPIYSQINGNFMKNMAIIDLLFNEGPNSREIILKTPNI